MPTYVARNLISITDGQIYFDTRLFAAGITPAIDVTSRIDAKGRHLRMKRPAGRMKLVRLQVLELEMFTHFGTKLESSMEAEITRGGVLHEIFKKLMPWPDSQRHMRPRAKRMKGDTAETTNIGHPV